MEEYTETSLCHLDFSDNFFDLVQAVLGENIKQGNKTTSIQPATNNKNKREKEYRHQTKWSDNRILIPVLFSFFHGIELFLKGIKYLNNDPEKKPDHKLSNLTTNFKKDHPEKTVIIKILEYYIYPENNCEILSDFYKTNKIADSSKFYEVFKYPSNNKFDKDFNYKDLKRNGEKGIKLFEKIINDIETLRNEKKKFK
jgi:hypothetical protein